MPGFTVVSMFPQLWEASGVPLPALVDRLMTLALERHAARARRRLSFSPGAAGQRFFAGFWPLTRLEVASLSASLREAEDDFVVFVDVSARAVGALLPPRVGAPRCAS